MAHNINFLIRVRRGMVAKSNVFYIDFPSEYDSLYKSLS